MTTATSQTDSPTASPIASPIASAPDQNITPSATPRVRTSIRRAVFWIVAALFALAIVAVSMLVTRGASIDADELSAGNSTPNGGRALAQVLRQQGVDVIESTTLRDTLAAAGSGGETSTVLLYDPIGYLDEAQLDSLADRDDIRLVVISPRDDALRAFAPGLAFGGSTEQDDVLDARCDLGAASRAGNVTGGWTLYTASGAADATGCFIGPFGNAGVVSLDDGRVTIIGSANAFTNGTITSRGNAALGLGLLGGTDRLVWYLPSINDVAVTGPPSLDALTPGWVAPVTGILVITAIAAMLWRGRRFGPLVIENLPVTVRASETMEGRARLYQRSSNRGRALDALRIGTITRLSGVVGLSRHTTVPEIAATVAGLTGLDPHHVRAVLLDTVPSSDAALVTLSDQLLDLEAATRRAIDLTERTTS